MDGSTCAEKSSARGSALGLTALSLTLAQCLHFSTSELAFDSATFVPLYFKLMLSQSQKAMQL